MIKDGLSKLWIVILFRYNACERIYIYIMNSQMLMYGNRQDNNYNSGGTASINYKKYRERERERESIYIIGKNSTTKNMIAQIEQGTQMVLVLQHFNQYLHTVNHNRKLLTTRI